MPETLPIWSALPFVGILLSIALVPLASPRFWHRHYPKLAIAWALVFALPYLACYRAAAAHELAHVFLADYVPFVLMAAALFIIAGGIVIRGAPAASPVANTAMLGFGTLLASCVGTTGASMLLIRPLLRANAGRSSQAHLVAFFIFLVANIGGCLTPMGDPPLFLGFLAGVPFFWTLRLAGPFALLSTILLAAFYLIDRRRWGHDVRSGWRPTPREGRLRIEGRVNVVLLLGVVTAVLLSARWPAGVRDSIVLGLAALSLAITPRALREANGFTWAPIREVAWLFAGIFVTIVPALAILRAGRDGPLGSMMAAIETPWHLFWATGGLSAFLDNAPTYLAFLHSLVGRFHPGIAEAEAVRRITTEQALHLEAVAAGAVFMGALTYIGNAPNFMVKSIAQEAGLILPSFFGYLFRWAVPILVPSFLLVGWIFFRG